MLAVMLQYCISVLISAFLIWQVSSLETMGTVLRKMGRDSSSEMLTLGRGDPGWMGDSSAENGDRDGSSNRGIAEWDGPAGSDRDSTSAGESDYGSSRSDGTNDTEDPGDSSTMPADVMEAMKN